MPLKLLSHFSLIFQMNFTQLATLTFQDILHSICFSFFILTVPALLFPVADLLTLKMWNPQQSLQDSFYFLA